MPNTIGLNAEAVGLQLDERGAIVVDGDCKTNLPGVWAVGDVVRGPMLAHKAEKKALPWLSALLAAWSRQLQHHPLVIYTSPEIAWVAAPSSSSRPMAWKYKAGTFPFIGQRSRTRAGRHDRHGQVPGRRHHRRNPGRAHRWAPWRSELISEAVVAMEFKASAEDIARICHAHPSLSEATKGSGSGRGQAHTGTSDFRISVKMAASALWISAGSY